MDFKNLKHGERIIIAVRTGASKTEVSGFDKGKNVKVSVKAPPQDGKANAEIIKLFSRLSGKKAEIASGKTSRRKVIRII